MEQMEVDGDPEEAIPSRRSSRRIRQQTKRPNYRENSGELSEDDADDGVVKKAQKGYKTMRKSPVLAKYSDGMKGDKAVDLTAGRTRNKLEDLDLKREDFSTEGMGEADDSMEDAKIADVTIKEEFVDSEIDLEVDAQHNGMQVGTYYEYILIDIDNFEYYFGTVSQGHVCVMWERNEADGEIVYTSIHHPGRRLKFVKRILHEGLHHLDAAYNAEINSEARKKVAELRKMTLVNKQNRTWAVKCLPKKIQIKLSRIVQRLASDDSIHIEDMKFPFKFKVSILFVKNEPQDSTNDSFQAMEHGDTATSQDFIQAFEDESNENIDEVSVFGENTEEECVNDGDGILIDSVFAGLKKGCYYEYILIDVKTKELYCGTVSDRDVCVMWDTQEQDGEIVYTSCHHPGRVMKKLERVRHTGIHHLEALYCAEIISEARKICASLRNMNLVNKNIRTWAGSCLPSSMQEAVLTILMNSASSSTSLHLLGFPFQFKVQIQMFKLEMEDLQRDFTDDQGMWEKKPRFCYFCNKPSSNLVIHLRTHTKEKPYVCKYAGCGKEFADLQNLNLKHMRIHTKEKPFNCKHPGCGKNFLDVSNLKAHMRIHTKETPFVCNFPGCGKKCAYSSNLKAHMRTHTNEKPFVCSYPGCGKKCAFSSNLKKHMRTHTQEKPSTCTHPGCGKTFLDGSHLKRHMLTHTKEKPFVCNFPGCVKALQTNSDLKRHMRTHTKEKPHACKYPGCGYTCSENSNLKKHMRTHTKEKPFTCNYPGCGKAFTESSSRSRHMQLHQRRNV